MPGIERRTDIMFQDNWKDCKNILCLRPDNMGDLLMSVPAIRALRNTTGARITVLTSTMAAGIAKMIPEIDEVIVYDLPWVKARQTIDPASVGQVAADLSKRGFDAAVVFTVYSQNPLPTAMLAYLAGIPRRLAYCRENPYELLTHWVPDREPYSQVKHQVRRDLDLVAAVGAITGNEHLDLSVDSSALPSLKQKLAQEGVDPDKPWLILHPGVSEVKREYPAECWVEAGGRLAHRYQLLLTGGPAEKDLTDRLASAIGAGAFSMAGKLSLPEFVLLIEQAPLLISVNTGSIHIASAVSTPVLVLYAQTNPQHFPWKVKGRVLSFSVPEALRSRNEVISYANARYFPKADQMVQPDEVAGAAEQILEGNGAVIPELPGPDR